MLARVVICGAAAADRTALAAVAAEFPTLALEARATAPADAVVVDGDDLFACAAASWALDRALDDVDAVALPARDAAGAVALVTRLQRLIERRNEASATRAFDAALAAHRALYELSKPLVRADYDHARDAWHWLLRLEPRASAAPQLAILFHDVERLASEADARVEPLAADYDAFKRAHAAAGAALVRATLAPLPLDAAVVDEAAALVAAHDQPGGSADAALINDADALSFFSLNSSGYLDYFGAARTRDKIAWTLARLTERGRARLPSIRLRDDVRALVAHQEAA